MKPNTGTIKLETDIRISIIGRTTGIKIGMALATPYHTAVVTIDTPITIAVTDITLTTIEATDVTLITTTVVLAGKRELMCFSDYWFGVAASIAGYSF